METFNLAQLTKEMVVGQLRTLQDPTRLAAETVRGAMVARLKGHRLSNYEIQEAVSEICRGGIAGMILMECPMGRCAARILMSAEAAAKEAGLDRELVLVAAVRGVADARRFVTSDVLREMRSRMTAVWAGASEVFDQFNSRLLANQSHPGYIPPKV